uniref:Uncharacterized protein n=1 Tax=Knipowitschia caucasica TaxID=637954 RepID=A0AAV2KN75_KNICA
MSSLQVSAVLLCLLGLSCAAFDPDRTRYGLSREFSKVLDQGLKMAVTLDQMVYETGLEEEVPSVTEFVVDLMVFIKNTKDFTQKQMKTMEDEFEEKQDMIHALALEALD